jgi:predicted ester cyclase
MGMPATGQSIHVNAMVMMTVADGRVTELRGVFDQAAMMHQLGVGV